MSKSKRATASAGPKALAPPLLPPGLMERLLSAAMEGGGDFAEVYVERAETTAVVLEERRVKNAQTGLRQGVGVRVIAGHKVGYAYSDDLEDEALFRAARTAALIARGGGSPRSFQVSRTPAPMYYRVAQPLSSVEVSRKADLVLRADKAAHAYDRRVKVVTATYADVTKRIWIANTRGHFAEDTQDLCRLSVSVVAEGKNKERRSGFFGGGGRVGFNHFLTFTPEHV
ncbi:MAG TPA: DNA gyrase modulator, partial [Myxococcaceae bacterium]